MQHPLLLRLLQRVHRVVLHLYPREFRREYGLDMDDVFVDLCLAQSRRAAAGTVALSGTWNLLRIAKNGLGARFGGRQRPPFEISPRFELPSRPGATFMSALLQDIRFALRALAQHPGFSLLVVGMLALGIGANTAIFSIFNSVHLRPLPFADPLRLVDLDETAPRWGLEYVGISPPDFAAWYENNQTFDGMAIYSDRAMNLVANGNADRVGTMLASWELASVLGVSPIIGRDFTADDDTEGAEPVALLTYAAWRDRFASDAGVIGAVLHLDEVPYAVIGVLPATATLPYSDVEIWVPVHSISSCCGAPEEAGSYWLSGIGRLADGVTIEQARADLDRAHAPLVESLGQSRAIATPRLEPYVDLTLGDSVPAFYLLLGAVAILLLISCANIGGLMLARSSARTRELGLRAALGANRWRLVRQLFTEAVVLAAAGGIGGAAVGYAGFRGLVGILPVEDFAWISMALDWRFALFSFAVSGAAGVIFGLAPAISTARVDPQEALQDGSNRASAGVGRRRALRGLVVAEITLAVVLLVGAGLLVRSFQALRDIDPGFRSDVLTATMALPPLGYEEVADQLGFWETVKDRVAALPGVETVGLTSITPLSGHNGYFFAAENAIERPEDESQPVILVRQTSADYFDAMGIRFRSGEAFGEYDGLNDAPQTIVVNESFARHYWDRVDVVGERVRTGGDDAPWLTIVGVAYDTRHYGLDEEPRPGAYLPYRFPLGNQYTMSIAVAGGTEPKGFADGIRSAVRDADPGVPVYRVATMEDNLDESTFTRRAYSTLLSVFAGAALLLAAAGIYSTLSYAVSQRRQEIGIRMALGARGAQVQKQILGEGVKLTVIGLLAGLGLSVFATRAMSSLLLGVSASDPWTYVTVTMTLAFAALLANWLPAHRASRTNPTDALRGE